jgi:hypothetical protein
VQPDAHAQPATEIVIHADEQRNGVDARHGLMLSIDAVRRLSCDAWIRRVTDHDRRHDAGRRNRRVPRRLRRQIVRRDGDRCRFAGCTNRHYLHVHHIVHWDDGGPTDVDNLVLLCSFHHKLVHEGGWRVDGNPNHALTFVAPDGRRLDEEPTRLPPADWQTVPADHGTITGDAINTAHGEPKTSTGPSPRSAAWYRPTATERCAPSRRDARRSFVLSSAGRPRNHH